MKLVRVCIIAAETCGGLLDDVNVGLRSPLNDYSLFDPLCLIGPNGSGKSQFLQVIAEIFQSVFHTCISEEERIEGNPELQFEIEYFIYPQENQPPIRVRISREAVDKKRPPLIIQRREEYDWIDCDPKAPETHALLPQKVVGYTSGNNETLSLPFLVSRSGYADEVGRRALNVATRSQSVPDTRLMLIDYETHLEVLVANLLLGEDSQREALLKEAQLQDLHSFRCIIQLAHQKKSKKKTKRKGIQLTDELETYIDQLQRCATCYTYDDKTETYIFDYWINEHTREAFRSFWGNALNLYSSFHKLAMLNDLVLSKKTRDRFRRDTRTPKTIQKPVTDLFTYAFEILTDLGIRDKHYKAIYDAASYHICPFCGYEYFDAPGARREALDHYLSKEKYAFAAANLRNLVPMGNKCNSRYKLAQDILRKEDGTRRKSFDPYNHRTLTVSLDNSQPFAGTTGKTGERLPKWEIDFGSNSEEVATWDDVFHIRERYKRDVLDEAFHNWLNGFRSWCRHPRKTLPKSDKELVDAIEDYVLYYESLGFDDRAFLKAAVFRMLHKHCKNGDERLIQFIKNVVGVSV